MGHSIGIIPSFRFLIQIGLLPTNQLNQSSKKELWLPDRVPEAMVFKKKYLLYKKCEKAVTYEYTNVKFSCWKWKQAKKF